jgi:RHS repeat-associated protein
VTDAVSYDAWGNILSSSGTTANAFKYVGQLGYYADSDSGLMLLGARYYGASGGRFLTLDPIGHAGGLNLYGYVGNNPVLRVDPQGLESEQDIINDIKKIIDRIKKILEERRRREKAAVDCIERAERNFIKCVSRTAQDTKACMKGCWARCLPSIFGGIAYPICLQVCWDACRQQGETRLRRCEEDLKDDVEDCKRQYSDVWPR